MTALPSTDIVASLYITRFQLISISLGSLFLKVAPSWVLLQSSHFFCTCSVFTLFGWYFLWTWFAMGYVIDLFYFSNVFFTNVLRAQIKIFKMFFLFLWLWSWSIWSKSEGLVDWSSTGWNRFIPHAPCPGSWSWFSFCCCSWWGHWSKWKQSQRRDYGGDSGHTCLQGPKAVGRGQAAETGTEMGW